MTTPFPFTIGQVLTAAQLNAITTLPINDRTASYVALVGDVGKRIVMNVATANTLTINNSVFAVGDTVEVLNKGAGATTVTAGAGVTINSASGLVLVQNQSGQLVALSASSFLFVLSEGPSGVLQVLQTAKIDTFSSTTASYIDVTGLSVTITPRFSNSKILVSAQINAGLSDTADSNAHFKLVGGNTANYLPAAAGNRTLAQFCVRFRDADFEQGFWGLGSGSIQFLDSPATTSATTYKVQIIVPIGTGFVNRGGEDANLATISRQSSSITVMEISA